MQLGLDSIGAGDAGRAAAFTLRDSRTCKLRCFPALRSQKPDALLHCQHCVDVLTVNCWWHLHQLALGYLWQARLG